LGFVIKLNKNSVLNAVNEITGFAAAGTWNLKTVKLIYGEGMQQPVIF